MIYQAKQLKRFREYETTKFSLSKLTVQPSAIANRWVSLGTVFSNDVYSAV